MAITPGMERWEGRVALVTGASSGIGRAVAWELAREGMKVAAAARSAHALATLVDDIREAGGSALAVTTDVRDEAQIKRAFARIEAAWGGVDVLVNNAGLGLEAPLTSGETDRWREMLEVNVLGLSICTREAVADMRQRGDDGHILHISSMAAHRVLPGAGMYGATKHAVMALTEALRMELYAAGSSIRVTAISPGYVETNFAPTWHGGTAAQRAETAERTYGRFPVLQPEDISAAVLFALSQPAHVQVHDLLVRPLRQER